MWLGFAWLAARGLASLLFALDCPLAPLLRVCPWALDFVAASPWLVVLVPRLCRLDRESHPAKPPPLKELGQVEQVEDPLLRVHRARLVEL